MSAKKGSLTDRLSRNREINITVTGRKSGQAITNPVWFVSEGEKIYLLPVSGSDKQWSKNVLKKPAMRSDGGGAEGTFKAVPLTDVNQGSSVVQKFRQKYGAGDVMKYYVNCD